ncbi:glycoside hydrolase family 30 protein [Laccaria amethystina LaAM-08-1]|uniref:Glycoside hydrolase family 30 protein n=1 Tax=Laccaria amethystina LaAM-08-1 TaxID=1095629 RepID=A0A0C9XEX6_9AGAR|nr:glycoside hydrolase family 30 protein [Laccaria amethystina LaAM-08-1]
MTMGPNCLRCALLFSSALLALAITSIDSKPRQTIISFGVNAGKMFFSESGLWLSNYCYNVGGGGVGVTAPKAVAQYFLRPDDTYDWSSDKAGVTFLKMAQDHNVPYITFFVSSAPPSISLNKTSCGWDMTSRQVQPFANYLTTIVSHWKNEGINVTYISSMNEPINNRECCGQEVMGVPVFLRGPVFVALNAALRNASTSNVGIIDFLTALAVHNYDFPTDGLVSSYAWIARTASGLPIRFAETCCSTSGGAGPSQYHPTIVGALLTSRYVWQALTLANAESFDWWQKLLALHTRINSNGWNDGLIYFDPDHAQLYLTKRYWALRHFSYFTRPGSTCFKVNNTPSGVVAISTLNAGTWNVLFIDQKTNSVPFSLKLTGTSAKVTSIIQTTAQDDWAAVTTPPAVSSPLQLTLPAQSIFPVQFITVSSPTQRRSDN